jgi:hypothetical protein
MNGDEKLCTAETGAIEIINAEPQEVVHACDNTDGDGHLEHECSCGVTWTEEATC